MKYDKWSKICCELIFVCLAVSTITLFLFDYKIPRPLRFGTFHVSKNETNTKTILLWTKYWGDKQKAWGKIFRKITREQCPVNNCRLEINHNNLRDADAVLFHPMDLYPEFNLPKYHSSDQHWIFFSLEAPPVMEEGGRKFFLRKVGNVFNWTMTYRRDSDIVVPYGQFIPIKPTSIRKIFWREKNKMTIGAWMVSHCTTDSRREIFMEELQKHIRVDVFGKCGTKTCGKKLSIGTIGTFDHAVCNEEIRKYLFYFALENAICTDYVTEKFYLALSLDVVPVVLGGADYASIAPFNSYIDALQFPSPKDLATFLSSLAADEHSYNQYFEWKDHFTVTLGHPFAPMVCDLCARLHNKSTTTTLSFNDENNDTVKTKGQTFINGKVNGTYEDIDSWFIKGSNCKPWVLQLNTSYI